MHSIFYDQQIEVKYKFNVLFIYKIWDGSNGREACCGLKTDKRIDFQQGHEIFFCHSKTSRPAVVPTKPPYSGGPEGKGKWFQEGGFEKATT
jgi:hypothetical protein